MGKINANRPARTIFGGGGPYTTNYEYWDDGKLKSIDYPGAGPTVSYAYYPGTDLLNTVSAGSITYATFSLYEPTGLAGQIAYQNGAVTTNTYFRQLARLTRLTTTSGGQTIQDYQYCYTHRGNVSSVVDHHNSITYNYTYDDLHRLISESVSGGGTTLSMDYDPLGNIVSKATAGNSLAYSYGTAGRPHRLTSITQNGSPTYNYAYDSNGNMTTCFDLADPAGMKQRSILYNAENMPTQIDVFPYGGGTSTTYGFSYDGNGRRVLKWIGGIVNTVYVGPHFEVVNGVEASYIFAGTQRIAEVTGTATKYFHQDHLGSATRLTNETGQLMEQAEYLLFGQMRSGSSSPPFASNYKYTDQELDVGIGLYNYDARMYDPIIGRFISPDPIVGDPMNPQALNRYSYVLNNPLRYVDPRGNESVGATSPGMGSDTPGWSDYVSPKKDSYSDASWAYTKSQEDYNLALYGEAGPPSD
jgi:RHS repeat-associated protein